MRIARLGTDHHRPRRRLTLVVAAVLLAGGCGDGEADPAPQPTTTVAPERSTAPGGADDPGAGGDAAADDHPDADGASDEGAARTVAAAVDRTRRQGTWRVEVAQEVTAAGRTVGTSVDVVHDAATGRSEVRSDAAGGFEVSGADPLAGLWRRAANGAVPDGAVDPAALLDVVDGEAPTLVRAVGPGEPVDGDATDRYELTTSLARLVGDRLSDTEAADWLAEVADQVGLGSSGAPSWVPDAVRDPWADWVAPSATGAAERLVSIPATVLLDVDGEGLLRRASVRMSMGTVVGVLVDGPLARRAADLAESRSTVTFLEPL